MVTDEFGGARLKARPQDRRIELRVEGALRECFARLPHAGRFLHHDHHDLEAGEFIQRDDRARAHHDAPDIHLSCNEHPAGGHRFAQRDVGQKEPGSGRQVVLAVDK